MPHATVSKFLARSFVVTALFGGSLTADTLVRNLPESAVQAKVPVKAWAFELERVRLLDGPFKRAMEADAKYLLDIEPDRLLSRFRKFSGLEPKREEYKGWESATISGHTLGHYLTAVSLMYASTGDKRFLDRANYIVDELALAQKTKGTGFVGGFPDQDRLWKEIAAGQIKSQPFDLNGIWVPWYTTHKLLAGLMDAYTHCDSRKAKDVMVRFADWTIELTKNLNDDQMQQMLATEHGGVLESYTDVYAVTGDPKYLQLARRFYHRKLMDPLAAENDILTGLHGNTQIPKVIGAARLYAVTGDEDLRTISRFFWDNVVGKRSYVNGGHGDGEYFFPPDRFSEHVTSRTAETCNTYNMLKLTRHLFSWTASTETADFYERALYNHILASQHPENGMMIYLCSMRPGHFKVFNTPFESFWCCTGSGMENHAKYGDSIYFHDEQGLYVNLFIASELDWKEKGLKITQQTQFPESPLTRFEIQANTPTTTALRLRHPWWAESALRISVNGRPVQTSSAPGQYAVISREWQTGDLVEVALPMKLRVESLPGEPDRVAVLYGPVLLAGDMGTQGMEPPIPLAKDQLDYDTMPSPAVPVVVSNDRNPEKWLKKSTDKPLTFVAARRDTFRLPENGSAQSPKLIPFYHVYDQRYTVYWHLFTNEGWKKKQAEYTDDQRRMKSLEPRLTDVYHPGEVESERAHNVKGEHSAPGEFELKRHREAVRGGWFSFKMKVDPASPMELVCTYWGGQTDRSFEILIDGKTVATEKLNKNKPGEFVEIAYPIPEDVTRSKETVTVKLQAQRGGRGAGPLFRAWLLKK